MHGYGKSRLILLSQIEHACIWENVASITGTTDDYCPN